MAVVRELITRLGFGVDQGSMNRAENSINKLSGMLSGLAAFASLRALAGVADSMQSLEARIGMLPQTIGNVGDAFNTIAERASNARQPIEAYGTMYIRLAGATKEYLTTQEDVLLVTDAISNALVVGGAVASEQASAMLQLSQAFQKGKLDGDEFKSFMENLSSDFKDKLAKQIGTTADKLYDLSSSGQLTAKKLALAFKAMAPEIEKQMLSMPMTIGHAMTFGANKFKAMVQNMNRESMAVTKIAAFFKSTFESIELKILSFIKFVGGGTNALKTFGIVLAALLGPMALGGLLSILGAILSPAGLVVAALVLLGLAIDDIYSYMDGGQSLFGDFLKDLKNGDLLTVGLTTALVGLTAQFAYVAIAYAAMWAKMRITAMIEGAKVLAIQLAAMGPTGWAIAAGAGISLGAAYLLNQSNDVGLPKVGPGSVTPATMLPNLAPASATSPTVHQTNNFTMPPGTPQSHINLLEQGAVNFLGQSNDKLARDLNAQGN
jgi:tape measure domain-containing protein